MPELTEEDRALVTAALGATSRWLTLMSAWLAEAGTEPEAAHLAAAAADEIETVRRRLSPTTFRGRNLIRRRK